MVDRVKIGGVTYTVERVDEVDHDRDTDGSITYSAQSIRIRKDIQPDQAMRVLLHEILHAITKHAHIPLPEANEETIIDSLAYGLLAVIQDNPTMFG